MKKDYPIKKLFDKGVVVTINTDNMTVSNTNLENEFSIISKEFGFTKQDEEKLLLNSVKATFLSEKEKEELRKTVMKKLQKKTEAEENCMMF